MFQTGKFVVCKRKISQSDLRAWKTTLTLPPHMKWDIFQILNASLAVAHIAACLCAKGLQHTQHNFQFRLCLALNESMASRFEKVCNYHMTKVVYPQPSH